MIACTKPSPLLVACCYCHQVKVGFMEYRTDPSALAGAGEEVSHTYCPGCAELHFGISRDAYRLEEERKLKAA